MYFNQPIFYQQKFTALLPRPYALSYHFILAQTRNLQAAHANILSEKHLMHRKLGELRLALPETKTSTSLDELPCVQP
jgi:hypothetical protein